jgi:hypothetical protein
MPDESKSSTDLLLNLLRKKTESAAWERGDDKLSQGRQVSSISFTNATLYVDVRDATITILAREKYVHMGRYEYVTVPLSQPAEETEDFPAVLRDIIRQSTAVCRKVELVGLVRSDSVYQTVLTVPKLRHSQLSTAVFWTLKKELKDVDEETHFIDFRVRKRVSAPGNQLSVLVTVVPRSDIELWTEWYAATGIKLQGVVLASTCLSDLISAVPEQDSESLNSLLLVHIEKNYSVVLGFENQEVCFSRILKIGSQNFVDELLGTQFENEGNTVFMPELVSAYAGYEKDIFSAVSPVASRFEGQIERAIVLLDDLNISIPQRVYISGDYSWDQHFLKFLSEKTGSTVLPLVALPPEFLPTSSMDATRHDAAFASHFGAVLSVKKHDVNLLYDFAARDKQYVADIFSLGTMLLLTCLLFIQLVVVSWQYADTYQMEQEIQKLEAQYSTYSPSVSLAMVEYLTEDLLSIRKHAKRLGYTLMPAALLTSLNKLPADNIKLIRVHYVCPEGALHTKQADEERIKAPVPEGTVIVEGVVLGDEFQFNAALSMFVAKIGQSSVFSMPAVTSKEIKEIDQQRRILRFTLQFHVGEGEEA